MMMIIWQWLNTLMIWRLKPFRPKYCNINIIIRHLAIARLWCVCVIVYLYFSQFFVHICRLCFYFYRVIFGEWRLLSVLPPVSHLLSRGEVPELLIPKITGSHQSFPTSSRWRQVPGSVRWVTAAALKDKRLTYTEQSYRQKLCSGLATTYLPPLPTLPSRPLPRFDVGYGEYHAHYINTGRKPADLWSNPSPSWYHQHSGYEHFPLDFPPRTLHFPWIPLLECEKTC